MLNLVVESQDEPFRKRPPTRKLLTSQGKDRMGSFQRARGKRTGRLKNSQEMPEEEHEEDENDEYLST